MAENVHEMSGEDEALLNQIIRQQPDPPDEETEEENMESPGRKLAAEMQDADMAAAVALADAAAAAKPSPKKRGRPNNAAGKTKEEIQSEREKAWWDMYEQLKAFKVENGHTNVPYRKDDEGKVLPFGGWVAQQRRKYVLGKLEDHRVEAMNQLDFVWRPSKRPAPPPKSPKAEATGDGTTPPPKRRSRKSGLKAEDLEVTAAEIMSPSDPTDVAVVAEIERDDAWDESYNNLKDFKKKMGHFNVPNDYEKDAGLSRWVRHMKRAHIAGDLSSECSDLLVKIGLVQPNRKRARKSIPTSAKKPPAKKQKAAAPNPAAAAPAASAPGQQNPYMNPYMMPWGNPFMMQQQAAAAQQGKAGAKGKPGMPPGMPGMPGMAPGMNPYMMPPWMMPPGARPGAAAASPKPAPASAAAPAASAPAPAGLSQAAVTAAAAKGAEQATKDLRLKLQEQDKQLRKQAGTITMQADQLKSFSEQITKLREEIEGVKGSQDQIQRQMQAQQRQQAVQHSEQIQQLKQEIRAVKQAQQDSDLARQQQEAARLQEQEQARLQQQQQQHHQQGGYHQSSLHQQLAQHFRHQL